MINKRCGGKRELSIYSILTIIVLISISDVGESEGVKGLPQNDKASLLVTDSDLQKSKIETDIISTGKPFEKIFSSIQIQIKVVEIDGVEKYNMDVNSMPFHDLEIMPGQHNFMIKIKVILDTNPGAKKKNTRYEDVYTQTSTCVFEPMSVYVLKRRMVLVMSMGTISKIPKIVIEKAPHSYDPKTGYATHPTDSKLSFKVK